MGRSYGGSRRREPLSECGRAGPSLQDQTGLSVRPVASITPNRKIIDAHTAAAEQGDEGALVIIQATNDVIAVHASLDGVAPPPR